MSPALEDFTGSWRIERRIEDRLGGQEGRFEGRARFAAAGPGRLDYLEEGLLTLGGAAPVTATRAYVWRQEGGLIVVDHADGRVFHAFDPAAPKAEHLCAPDRYCVAYDFAGWPGWRAVWQVSGPRKDYTLVSHYARA